MNAVIVWFLVIAPSGSQNSPHSVGPIYEHRACEQMANFYRSASSRPAGSRREAECVQDTVPAKR